MVGIVGILLLGSLAWSAVGALFSALGEATATFSTGRPTPTKLTGLIGTPTRATVNSAPAQTPVTTAVGTATPGVAAAATPRTTAAPTSSAPTSKTPAPTATLVTAATATPLVGAGVALTPTPAASGRAPWILLPQPAPDSRVAPGPLVIEARGRGDTPITVIRLDLDGVPLAVSLEQRSDSIWRGFANAQVAPGHHAVRATVIDEQGRSGGFRWNFDAGP
jgi:hypothetical protein